MAETTFSRSLFGYVEEEVLGCELYQFVDSSKKAYCAALYLRYTESSGIYTSLTRVAPLKRLSIPCLELMAAWIFATLSNTVKGALTNQLEISDTALWLDCMIALIWIDNKGE